MGGSSCFIFIYHLNIHVSSCKFNRHSLACFHGYQLLFWGELRVTHQQHTANFLFDNLSIADNELSNETTQ